MCDKARGLLRCIRVRPGYHPQVPGYGSTVRVGFLPCPLEESLGQGWKSRSWKRWWFS